MDTTIAGQFTRAASQMGGRALLVALVACLASAARAQSVSVVGGNVVYRDQAGATRNITTSGLERLASLSPDGRWIAFIRGTPGELVETAMQAAEATELWIAPIAEGAPHRLLHGRTGRSGDDFAKTTLARLAAPTFSPDGKTIYVESAGWVTSGALHAVNVATGAERFVCASNGFEVIPGGRYRGHLLVSQHRYFAKGSGSYEATYLITPTGREVGLVTLDETPDAERRLAAVRAGAPLPRRRSPQRALRAARGPGVSAR